MNAKQELIEAVSNLSDILCVKIKRECKEQEYLLKKEYSNEDLENFLNSLDFEYDDGYGCQELDGVIWMKDGTWHERGEYDGAEWWEYKKCPDMPQELIKGEK